MYNKRIYVGNSLRRNCAKQLLFCIWFYTLEHMLYVLTVSYWLLLVDLLQISYYTTEHARVGHLLHTQIFCNRSLSCITARRVALTFMRMSALYNARVDKKDSGYKMKRRLLIHISDQITTTKNLFGEWWFDYANIVLYLYHVLAAYI